MANAHGERNGRCSQVHARWLSRKRCLGRGDHGNSEHAAAPRSLRRAPRVRDMYCYPDAARKVVPVSASLRRRTRR
eukprot:CAMPEP_0185204250 /NCGR_PEP_ID=MMETSP1140-20130426/54479_1 /TAXON_ID=298111 /ORGANISM="Pavlova sp., Strain CCMP459" /LENGTH=75 /DNA_ID=CAMNT_0027771791 /DNA_START=13 /DNA_END=237 /DNA_ORIENTATION=+